MCVCVATYSMLCCGTSDEGAVGHLIAVSHVCPPMKRQQSLEVLMAGVSLGGDAGWRRPILQAYGSLLTGLPSRQYRYGRQAEQRAIVISC